ncbi:hypothetical protein [Pseudomonas sp.]|uniref:hypothetical protein n=1 Tax=Pseudomonas sp. TaxID=306 RepID=UPI0037CCB044
MLNVQVVEHVTAHQPLHQEAADAFFFGLQIGVSLQLFIVARNLLLHIGDAPKRIDLGFENLEVDGLGEKVVTAGVQCEYLLVKIVRAREHDNGPPPTLLL